LFFDAMGASTRGRMASASTWAGKGCDIPNFKGSYLGHFRSFRLIFGRAIISWSALEAWVLFPKRARAAHSR
jgi:hypothetical protein